VNLAPSTTSHAFKICVNLPTWPPPSSIAPQVIKFQSVMNLDLRNIAVTLPPHIHNSISLNPGSCSSGFEIHLYLRDVAYMFILDVYRFE
jgi:hypothetical protein